MKAVCKYNHMDHVLPDLRKFAFMQDEKGILPLTAGRIYTVYGIKKNSFGNFILVLCDEEKLPWWMPATLFDPVNEEVPRHWKTERFPSDYGGEAVISAPAIYFPNEDEIEDGDPEGYTAFAEMQRSEGSAV